MIRKKIFAACFAVCILGFAATTLAQKGKSEIGVGYGYLSVYGVVNGTPYNTSAGIPYITYRYYLTGNVTIGLGVGTENISNWGTFTTFAPEVTFAYMDTWQEQVRIKLYGGLAYGVSIFQNNTLRNDEADNSGAWAYGFQATPIGIRIGRQFACFAELGFGYRGLFNGGLELRFPGRPVRHYGPQ